MKKALLILTFVLIVSGLAFAANPFVGKWVAQVGQGEQEQFLLVIDNETVIRGDPAEAGMMIWTSMGDYTMDKDSITIKGVRFLFNVDMEGKRIGLIGWVPNSKGGFYPILIILFRAAEEAAPVA